MPAEALGGHTQPLQAQLQLGLEEWVRPQISRFQYPQILIPTGIPGMEPHRYFMLPIKLQAAVMLSDVVGEMRLIPIFEKQKENQTSFTLDI